MEDQPRERAAVPAPGTCETCPAWVRSRAEWWGAYRVQPPTLLDDAGESGWPRTGPDDWCGQYPARRQASIPPSAPGGGFAESGRKGSIAHGRGTACRFVMPDPASIAPLESRNPPAAPLETAPRDHNSPLESLNAPKRPLPGASPEADDLARLARAARLTPDPEEAIAHLTDHARRLALDLERQRRITTDARHERDAALRLTAILFGALRQVGRIVMSPHPPDQPGYAFCPWCGATSPQSCRPYCARRQALAAYHGTPTTDGPPPPPPGTPLASDRNLIGRAEGDPFLPSGVSESRSVGETGCLWQANGSGETEKDPARGEEAFSGGKNANQEKPSSTIEEVERGFLDRKNGVEVNESPDVVVWGRSAPMAPCRGLTEEEIQALRARGVLVD